MNINFFLNIVSITIQKLIVGQRFLKICIICFFCICTFASYAFPVVAIAQTSGSNFTVFKIPSDCNTRECTWIDFVALGNEIIDFAVYIAIIGATIAFTVAGFKMIMNNGKPNEIIEAKKMITNAVVGIIITLTGWLIIDFILDGLLVKSEFRTLIE